MKERLREELLRVGACAVGFAVAGEIDPEVQESYKKWVEAGFNGEMNYLNRHIDLKKHTDNVLKDAKTVISLAFDYTPNKWRDSLAASISAYAYGEDYHTVIRETLLPVINRFRDTYGGKWRLCIDSAPVAERYWAFKGGVGKKGKNGSVIVEGVGAFCFLAEILTTVELPPDTESLEMCEGCNACVNACPGHALKGDGTMDARKCINYITIEKKGLLSEEDKKILSKSPGFIFGCDRCLRVCPHNKKGTDTALANFAIKKETEELIPEKLLAMEESEFLSRFNRSPFIYAGFDTLRRNVETFIALHKKHPDKG